MHLKCNWRYTHLNPWASRWLAPQLSRLANFHHYRENGGTLGMVPWKEAVPKGKKTVSLHHRFSGGELLNFGGVRVSSLLKQVAYHQFIGAREICPGKYKASEYAVVIAEKPSGKDIKLVMPDAVQRFCFRSWKWFCKEWNTDVFSGTWRQLWAVHFATCR